MELIFDKDSLFNGRILKLGYLLVVHNRFLVIPAYVPFQEELAVR